jgi:hypothetical protein
MAQNMLNKSLKKTVNNILSLIILLTCLMGFSQHRRHYSNQGGHYRNGHGSSHRGGHYRNARTHNHYTHHRR